MSDKDSGTKSSNSVSSVVSGVIKQVIGTGGVIGPGTITISSRKESTSSGNKSDK